MKRILLTILITIVAGAILFFPPILHYFIGYERATPIVWFVIGVMVVIASIIAIGFFIMAFWELAGKILNKKK